MQGDDYSQKNSKKKKGRGWHGDSRGHAEAGRKGGQARGRKSHDNTDSSSPGQGMTNDMGDFDEELTDEESVI